MITMMACAASGCGTIKHQYPVFTLPERPVLHFEATGDQCLNRSELLSLTEYVLRLQATARKYQRQIEIINGE